jgi:hypothetical protein
LFIRFKKIVATCPSRPVQKQPTLATSVRRVTDRAS